MFGKTSWYKNNKNTKKMKNSKNRNQKNKNKTEHLEVKSVMFVPHTPGSKLANRLRKEERRVSSITGYRVKIVERTGTQLWRMFCKKNPFSGLPCGREKCLTCKDEKNSGTCRKRNITYIMTCDTCMKKKEETDTRDKKREENKHQTFNFKLPSNLKSNQTKTTTTTKCQDLRLWPGKNRNTRKVTKKIPPLNQTNKISKYFHPRQREREQKGGRL